MVWTYRASVDAGWIDYNGHLNVAYYVLLFDRALDEALDAIGLGSGYRQAHGCSVFVGEQHVVYDREVMARACVAVGSHVLDVDDRRLIAYQEMWVDDEAPGDGRGDDHGDDHGDGGGRAEDDRRPVATNEVLCVHVNLTTRRALAWPRVIRDGLRGAHGETSERSPTRVGRAIRLRHPG